MAALNEGILELDSLDAVGLMRRAANALEMAYTGVAGGKPAYPATEWDKRLVFRLRYEAEKLKEAMVEPHYLPCLACGGNGYTIYADPANQQTGEWPAARSHACPGCRGAGKIKP